MSSNPVLPSAITAAPLDDGSLDAFTDRALSVAMDLGLSPAEAATHITETAPAVTDDEDAALHDEPRAALDVARYRVTSIAEAEWAMRRLAEAEAQIEAITRQAHEWVAEIEAWAAKESARPEATAAYFRGLLTEYLRDLRAEDPTTATVRLPSGAIESTAKKPAPKITDPDALVEWARQHRPDAVETVTTHKVPAATAKRLGHIVEFDSDDGTTRMFVTDDGEPIPGVTVTPPELSVRVKPANVTPRK